MFGNAFIISPGYWLYLIGVNSLYIVVEVASAAFPSSRPAASLYDGRICWSSVDFSAYLEELEGPPELDMSDTFLICCLIGHRLTLLVKVSALNTNIDKTYPLVKCFLCCR